MLLEQALAGGILLAKENATVLSVLPVVLAKVSHALDPPALKRAAQMRGVESEMGMLLALAGDLTGDVRLADLASDYPKRTDHEFFLKSDASSSRLQRRAEECTPEVVRSWGFLMNASRADFADRVKKSA